MTIFRRILIVIGAIGFFVLAAHAADLVVETKPVTNPDGTTTLVEERHTFLPQASAAGDITINVDAKAGSTVNINVPGSGLAVPRWMHELGFDTLRLPEVTLPEPRIVPTVAELESRCHYSTHSANKVIANIGAYTTVERFAIDGFWRDRPNLSQADRNYYYRKGCEVFASRLDDF